MASLHSRDHRSRGGGEGASHDRAGEPDDAAGREQVLQQPGGPQEGPSPKAMGSERPLAQPPPTQ